MTPSPRHTQVTRRPLRADRSAGAPIKTLRQPGRFVENFVVESWLEYLRQRERMTASDLLIREHVRSFHQGKNRRCTHMIYARPFARPGNQVHEEGSLTNSDVGFNHGLAHGDTSQRN